MKKKCILLFLIILVGMLILYSGKSYASNNVIPTASNNIKISLISKSSLVPLTSGYMRVFYDDVNKNIGVEYYDDNFNILSKRKIELELSYWGGFYAGNDAYYIVEGQANKEEDDTAEVIRVIKYDKNWNRLGDAKITSDPNRNDYYKVRYPFDNGCVEMTELDGNLYIVTGHEGYIDPQYGQGHQGFLMLKINESTMTGEIVAADLWHSFAQYIDYKDSNLYVLEQSEGSYCTILKKYEKETLKSSGYAKLLEYGGKRDSAWAVACYASVDGMAISSNNVICVGTSIDQSQYDNRTSNTAHNIYITTTPIDNISTELSTFNWLTNYADEGQCFTGLEITKINDNRFMISWEEYGATQEIKDNDILSTNILHYIFIDENGNKISPEYTAPATISDCRPIVKGSNVIYYASNENMVDFYTIDSNTGGFKKIIYRVAGENATWSIDNNGILTIVGEGDISVSPNASRRYPLSSVKSWFSSSGNAWTPIKPLVKKIVIKDGIISVPKNEFEYFSNLQEVILPNSMVSVEEEAFASCDNLRKIVMLSNVKNIGNDAFWAGYYSSYTGQKVNYATIYTTKGSYAENWANENNVSCRYIEELILTDSATSIEVKALGESKTTLVVNTLTESNNDYNDMKAEVVDKSILGAYNISTKNGMCAGYNEITFRVGRALKGKDIVLIQKMSNGEVKTFNKVVGDNGQIILTTDELSSFMIAIDPNDIEYLVGDVNGDEKVSLIDYAMVLAHVKRTTLLTGEELARADVNGDGKVTLIDYAMILAHVKKTTLLW